MASTFSKLNSEIRHNKETGNYESNLSERRDDDDPKESLANIGKKRERDE